MVKTQGRRGEVAAELHTDFPERFAERRRLFALDAAGQRREMELEEFWPHRGRVVLKFRGVDTIAAAESLLGCELQVRGAERVPLAADEVYVSELVGCTVYDRGAEVGRIEDVQFGAGDAPLLVVRSAKKEYLLPFAQAYLKGTDVERRRVDMELPQGMLELNAPLTEEEKRQQGG